MFFSYNLLNYLIFDVSQTCSRKSALNNVRKIDISRKFSYRSWVFFDRTWQFDIRKDMQKNGGVTSFSILEVFGTYEPYLNQYVPSHPSGPRPLPPPPRQTSEAGPSLIGYRLSPAALTRPSRSPQAERPVSWLRSLWRRRRQWCELYRNAGNHTDVDALRRCENAWQRECW